MRLWTAVGRLSHQRIPMLGFLFFFRPIQSIHGGFDFPPRNHPVIDFGDDSVDLDQFGDSDITLCQKAVDAELPGFRLGNKQKAFNYITNFFRRVRGFGGGNRNALKKQRKRNSNKRQTRKRKTRKRKTRQKRTRRKTIRK